MNTTKLIPYLLPAAMIAALGALSLGLILRGAAVFVPIFVALGASWGYSRHHEHHALAIVLADLTLIAVVAGAVIGLLISALPGLMLLAVVAALTAWDLAHFERRLQAMPRVEHAGDIERGHLRWLLISVLGGSVIAASALMIRTTLSFGVMFVLGLMAALALSWTIGALRRE